LDSWQNILIRCSTERIIDGLPQFCYFGSDLQFQCDNDVIAHVFLVYSTQPFQALDCVLFRTLQKNKDCRGNEPVVVGIQGQIREFGLTDEQAGISL
jgi:hypothetical protein